jgi:hypothetical protein
MDLRYEQLPIILRCDWGVLITAVLGFPDVHGAWTVEGARAAMNRPAMFAVVMDVPLYNVA